ncbi:unnamed protein product [Lathyrus oleraceus]
MEPPHDMFLGGEEECHSSESGWTMYIGSPVSDDDDDCYQVTHQIQGDAGIESDDSMVSDASSGPTHCGVNVNNPLRHFKKKVEQDAYDDYDDDDEVHEYFCYDYHKKENQSEEKKEEKKQKVSVQGGGRVKVRNNERVGTRK